MRRFVVTLLATACMGPALADGFREVGREGRLTEYEGELRLSGHFERRQDAETLVWRGDRVCFHPDADALPKLPASAESKGDRYFCFSNHRAAMDKLQLAALPPAGSCGVAGKARVVITRYTVETGGNVFDQAWLERVEKVDAKTPLACP